MITFNKTASIVGVLFLAGMLAGIPGNIIVQSMTSGPDYLAALSMHNLTLAIGAMLMLSTAIGDATHGVLMYPILKEHHTQLASGYFSFRIINAGFLAIQVLFILVQLPLAKAYADTPAATLLMLQSISTLCNQVSLMAYQLAMIFLGLAGTMLCYQLYRTGLIPKGIAFWGLFGYVTMFFGSVLEAMGYHLQLMHTIPGGLWEVFIGVYLIIKGFGYKVSGAEHVNLKTGNYIRGIEIPGKHGKTI